MNFAGGNGGTRYKGMGAMGVMLASAISGAVFPFHYLRGGSHNLTHGLLRCAVGHGVTCWQACPVDKILVKDGEVVGIKTHPLAAIPDQEITAKAVVSNVSLKPTFLDMIGPEVLGEEKTKLINSFRYDENCVCSMNLELDGDPEFLSADYDDGVQRCPNGFFGVEDACLLYTSDAADECCGV